MGGVGHAAIAARRHRARRHVAEAHAAFLAALDNPVRAAAVGRRARELAETKYSYDAYLERTRRACSALAPQAAPITAVKDVA